MSTVKMKSGFGEFVSEFAKVKTGIVGVVILAIFLFLAVFGDLLLPFPDATGNWSNIEYWQDNPTAAPPSWVNVFSSKKAVSSTILFPTLKKETKEGESIVQSYSVDYDYQADEFPKDVIFKVHGVGQIHLTVNVTRPDGKTIALANEQFSLGGSSQHRVSLEKNTGNAMYQYLLENSPDIAVNIDPSNFAPVAAIFSQLNDNFIDSPDTLKGKYTLSFDINSLDSTLKLDMNEIIVSGSVWGVLGTDTSKRDLFTGLILGVRWALLIGILTSLITVIVGVILGVVAAYYGGGVDWGISRVFEFFYLLPVLPFLIVLAAIFKPSIWILIGIICVFFWPGAYKPVYSMALQIKEETYVEASRALGSRKSRIIMRHIVPILLPYSFAQLALSIPGVIVYEASISLLGLGDPTIVTYGQMLHTAQSENAVVAGLWWWVVPPGLMIAFMGMSFAFIGSALDKILHPKLKTR